MWNGITALGSIIAAIAAVLAWITALHARGESRRSADAAETSAAAARDSAQIARVEAARAVERTDVAWSDDTDREDPGFLIYRNSGSTTAHRVRLALTINGQRIELARDEVTPGGSVEWDARDTYAEAQREAHEQFKRAIDSGLLSTPSPRFSVAVRVTWESALGTPSLAVLG